MMKVAIFGGSFNPVHSEHVRVVQAAVKSLSLDKIYIVPTAQTPNKTGKMQATTNHRLQTCRLAFSGLKQAEVVDWEIAAGGVSYSYLTCQKFAQMHAEDQRYFIVGADMLQNFPKWKNPRLILQAVTIAAAGREGESTLQTALKNFENAMQTSAVSVGYTGAKVSSTKVRVLASVGEDITPYVGKLVAEYVANNAVYYQSNLAKCKQFLTEERWQHTLRVAVMAVENCGRVGWDEQSALTAAILHDCAKYQVEDSPHLQGFTPPQGVPKPVMHQFSGAYMAEHTFGVTDATVLNAIRYHTSARANATPAERLIYLCDLLEEERTFPDVDELRAAFYQDIDKCFALSLQSQIAYLQSTGLPVYDLTLQAYQSTKEKL